MSLPEIPKEIREQLDRDVNVYGNGFAEYLNGAWRRLDPRNVIVSTYKPTTKIYGEPLLQPSSGHQHHKDELPMWHSNEPPLHMLRVIDGGKSDT